MIYINRGLDLPIAGEPQQVIHPGPAVKRVALVGADYPGMKPTMCVREGDRVKLGQTLFTDKKNEQVRYTAPAAGTVVAVNRGEKRVFLSLEIEVDGDEAETFRSWSASELGGLSREDATANLVDSGLWTALRTRPYDKVPVPGTVPHSVFVNAMDTNPLAADPDVVLAGHEEAFKAGVTVLTRLTDGPVFVCRKTSSKQPRLNGVARVSEQEFDGPHPAGLVGTHIHFLDPVGPHKTVWHLNYQDAVAVGELFLTGKLNVSRVIALAGPQVDRPRLIATRQGAAVADLTRMELGAGESRIVSGSALHGHIAAGPLAYLSRYAQQLTVLREDRERKVLRYVMPGFDSHSASNMFLGKLLGGMKRFAMTTTTNGSARAMVPIGTYEEVMPLDILATWLLRYLIVGDTDRAVALGALELAEEDIALCTYVCPGKYEYGPILRDVLTRIENEG
ncbi:MAG: Na(+)-translocating NADH-quinone reductase subunit A [Gammaproteobacteria bacterium]